MIDHDPLVIGDVVRFHAAGIPGSMYGPIVDIAMGYAIILGPDGKRYFRCIRDIEYVEPKKRSKSYHIIT